jgi:hypothetical protein
VWAAASLPSERPGCFAPAGSLADGERMIPPREAQRPCGCSQRLTLAGLSSRSLSPNCGLAFLPVVFLGSYLARWAPAQTVSKLLAIAFAIVPSYVLFGLLLMPVSALAVRTLGWRTPAGLEVRIADVDWPLLRWVRGMVMAHIVRLVAGAVFRGSPVWTAYLRLAGARLGRRVY